MKKELEFLYYKKQHVLDGKDAREDEMMNMHWKFRDEVNSRSLFFLLSTLIKSYIDTYPYHRYICTCLYNRDSPLHEEIPSELEIEGYDLYLSSKRMNRSDVEYMVSRIYKDDLGKTNARFLTELELKFKQSQEITQEVEQALAEKEFTKEIKDNGLVFKVEDSPISEIEITSDTFYLRTNPEKWIAYYG